MYNKFRIQLKCKTVYSLSIQSFLFNFHKTLQRMKDEFVINFAISFNCFTF